MHDVIVRLVAPQSDWHIVELTPNTLDQALAKQTADLLICNHLSAHYPDMEKRLADLVACFEAGWMAGDCRHSGAGQPFAGQKS